jgi:hypothetical protein
VKKAAPKKKPAATKLKPAAKKVDVVKAKKAIPISKKSQRLELKEKPKEKVVVELPAFYPEVKRKQIEMIPGKILTAAGWIKLMQED